MSRHLYQKYTIMTQGVLYNPTDTAISYRYVILRLRPSLTHHQSEFSYPSQSEALSAAQEHVDRILSAAAAPRDASGGS
jgi:hypothetical protein